MLDIRKCSSYIRAKELVDTYYDENKSYFEIPVTDVLLMGLSFIEMYCLDRFKVKYKCLTCYKLNKIYVYNIGNLSVKSQTFKNLKLFIFLKSKGYDVSLILKNDEFKFITIVIDNRKRFISFEGGYYCMGEIWTDSQLWYTYYFNLFPEDIISEYDKCLVVDEDFGEDYIFDVVDNMKAFEKYLSDNEYVEAYDFFKIKEREKLC